MRLAIVHVINVKTETVSCKFLLLTSAIQTNLQDHVIAQNVVSFPPPSPMRVSTQHFLSTALGSAGVQTVGGNRDLRATSCSPVLRTAERVEVKVQETCDSGLF